jgi:hypothetical protein
MRMQGLRAMSKRVSLVNAVAAIVEVLEPVPYSVHTAVLTAAKHLDLAPAPATVSKHVGVMSLRDAVDSEPSDEED